MKAFSGRYQKAAKKERGIILNEFVAATGYNRRYAAWLLRSHGKEVYLGRHFFVLGDASKKVKRRRARLYSPEVVKVLIKLWAMLDDPCGRRLVTALPGAIEALVRHGELELEEDVQAKVVSISPATVDRLLGEGYARFDTDRAWKVMQELDAATSLFVNVFLPSQKLVSKTRQGPKIRKRYYAPQPPSSGF